MALQETQQSLDKTHALVVPGQGSQATGKGLELAQNSPAAAAVWEESDAALMPHLEFPFSQLVWYGKRGERQLAPKRATAEITKTENAQPAIIIDALARRAALEEAGLLGEPGWHAGNSLGFVVALRNAGSLSIEGAVRLGEGRGEAFRFAVANGPRTSMFAMFNPDPELVARLQERYGLDICVKNPGQVVMGGEVRNKEKRDLTQALGYLKKELGQEDFQDLVTPLQVDAAFHSRYMRPAVPIFQRVVDQVEIVPPTRGQLVGGSPVRVLNTEAAIKGVLVGQLTDTEDWGGVMAFFNDQGVSKVTELNDAPRLATMNRRAYRGLVNKVTLPETAVIAAYRWTAPEAVLAMAGGAGESREEVQQWYLEWVANRSGLEPEELADGTHFTEHANLDSEDLKALRAAVRARFGRNVSEEEAKDNVTIGLATDATYKLISE